MMLLAENHMTCKNKTNHIWEMDKETRKSSSVVSQNQQIQVQYRFLKLLLQNKNIMVLN